MDINISMVDDRCPPKRVTFAGTYDKLGLPNRISKSHNVLSSLELHPGESYGPETLDGIIDEDSEEKVVVVVVVAFAGGTNESGNVGWAAVGTADSTVFGEMTRSLGGREVMLKKIENILG